MVHLIHSQFAVLISFETWQAASSIDNVHKDGATVALQPTL